MDGVLPGKASMDWKFQQLKVPVESSAQDIQRFSKMLDVMMTLSSSVDTFQ